MTEDEIIEMACNVGYPFAEYEGKPYVPPMLAILLKTATEAEREACAKVCEETTASWTQHLYNEGCIDCSKAIRARGET
jgi:hypothetical protein